MQHVIIGAGPAGVVAAETLRKLDPQSGVTIVGEEPEPPYSRMALPYFLVKDITEDGTHLRKSPGHFERKGITVLRDRVTRLDTHAKALHLQGGTTLAYDKLLIATGSRPIVPPIPGIHQEGVHNCWTLADGRIIAARAVPGAKVLLMGAGFIGCIILEALAASGADLTVVEMGPRMVPRMMNDKAGNLIKKWCEDKGVKVHTSTRVEAIEEGRERRFNVVLSNGTSVPADLVVCATGVKPNVEFLDGSGIKIDQGILVDRQMQTNLANVYAAGDVAQGLDFSTGQYSVQAIQPTASDHGQIAARNMAGLKGAVHRGCVNMNVLDTLGLISVSFGSWMGIEGGEEAELYAPERYRYLNLQFQDDVLIGATGLGHTDHVGVLRGLIQSKVRLGPWKHRLMENPTRIMEAYLGCTQALGHNAGLLRAAH